QAEDGIRDFHVTGVQTCALPIYAIRHLLRADNFLTRTMAATLGPDLVFNVATGGAEFDQALNRTGDIEGGRTEAGIDVHDQRNVTDVGDPAYIGQNVV